MFLSKYFTTGPINDSEPFFGNIDFQSVPTVDIQAVAIAEGVPGFAPLVNPDANGLDYTQFNYNDSGWTGAPLPLFNDNYITSQGDVWRSGTSIPTHVGTNHWIVRRKLTLPVGPSQIRMSDGGIFSAAAGECLYLVAVICDNGGPLVVRSATATASGDGYLDPLADNGSARMILSAPPNTPLVFSVDKTTGDGVYDTTGFQLSTFLHYAPIGHLIAGKMGEMRQSFRPATTFDVHQKSTASAGLTTGVGGSRPADCGLVGAGVKMHQGGNEWGFNGDINFGYRFGPTWSYGTRTVDSLFQPRMPLLDLGIADALSLEFTVAKRPLVASGSSTQHYGQFFCGGNVNQDLPSGITLQVIETYGVSPDVSLRLYHNNATVISTALASAPAPGQVVKIITDFAARLATVTYDGVVQATLDFSAQAWYTADGAGL